MKVHTNDSRGDDTLIILSPGFPGDETDTTCLPPQQVFVNRLRKEYPALNIVVIAFQYPFVNADYTWKGTRVISLNGRNNRQPERMLIWLKAWRKLKKLRKEHRVVGIFSFWCGECALIGKWFGKKYSIGHHCWVLGQDALKTNRYVKWIQPDGSDLVALSDFVAREFYKNHRVQPAVVIPTGVDPELFDTTPLEKDIDILGAGSLIPLKNYELFLHTIHLCRRQLPRIRAIICGKGPDEKRLKELIRIFRLEDNVHLAGEKEHPEVLKLMQRAKIFLHTSSYEGFGAVCIEALYAGAKVISFVKPMDTKIPGWHVVKSSREMIREIVDGLQQPAGGPAQPSLPYLMNDSVKAVMHLFGYGETDRGQSHRINGDADRRKTDQIETGQIEADRNEADHTGANHIEADQNRAVQNRAGQNKADHSEAGESRFEQSDVDRNGFDRTESDRAKFVKSESDQSLFGHSEAAT